MNKDLANDHAHTIFCTAEPDAALDTGSKDRTVRTPSLLKIRSKEYPLKGMSFCFLPPVWISKYHLNSVC